MTQEPLFKMDSNQYVYSCNGKLNRVCSAIAKWAKDKGFSGASWENLAEKHLLMVTEICESFQEFRKIKNIPGCDDGTDWSDSDLKLVNNIHEETADLAIRLFSFADEMGINLEDEIVKKMAKNEQRPHKHGRRC